MNRTKQPYIYVMQYSMQPIFEELWFIQWKMMKQFSTSLFQTCFDRLMASETVPSKKL